MLRKWGMKSRRFKQKEQKFDNVSDVRLEIGNQVISIEVKQRAYQYRIYYWVKEGKSYHIKDFTGQLPDRLCCQKV